MNGHTMKYYAHSLEGHPAEGWQLLERHLKNVSKLAANSADCFGARKWGSILGDKHDLGKGTRPWQAYLRRVNDIVDEFAKFYEGHPTHNAPQPARKFADYEVKIDMTSIPPGISLLEML